MGIGKDMEGLVAGEVQFVHSFKEIILIRKGKVKISPIMTSWTVNGSLIAHQQSCLISAFSPMTSFKLTDFDLCD